jgi:N6-L-threonylcarbamoyladenine synthase
MKILGIETSCDETAAAVFDTQQGMASSVIFSQIELHKQYGGVIPELASRSHLEKINGIVEQSLVEATCSLDDIDCVAVTSKPGLPGSLLIGLCFAKAIAWAKSKKLIGIDHLEGHIFSAAIENNVTFPHICLTASGGHTALYIVHDFGVFELIGQTLDDAAGEAFDKVAKMIGLAYPGGPLIERMARAMDFKDFFAYPRGKEGMQDFSFSGLKTAVLYDLVKRGLYDLSAKSITSEMTDEHKHHVASSLLVCIADIFEQKLALALKNYPTVQSITFVGGVACNKYIKNRLSTFAQERDCTFFTPSPLYCTDNAGMIAFVGGYKAERGEFSDLSLDIF